MPTTQTLERFVSMVEAGRGVEAVTAFYAERASMQENMGERRIGKKALVDYEQRAQASVTNIRSKCFHPFVVSGNIAVIRWVIEYTSNLGKLVRLEELAYQHWEDELIVEEQFFYDPDQFKLGFNSKANSVP